MSGINRLIMLSGIILLVGCGSAPQRTPGQANAPGWVREPYTRYDRNAYVAAVGSGVAREAAESSALANLVAIFGQTIQLDETITTTYEQASRSGVITSWSEGVAIDSAIDRLAGLDSLIGAEIGDTWHDGGSEFYAVAVLNRARAAQIYTDLIRSNQAVIDNLITFPPGERNTLDGVARFQLAAVIADMLVPYVNLLAVIGTPVQGLRSGADYRLGANEIIRTIPITLRVQNDRSGRIQGAFARALSELGFQSGGVNSPYLLDVDVVTAPVSISGNPNSWTRIEVNADLKDTRFGTVLLPYNFNSREGHTSQAEADNRAYMAAERRINNEYMNLFNNYLSQLVPVR